MKENLWLTLVTCLASRVDKELWKAVDYLKEQVRVLKEQQEKDTRILLNDPQWQRELQEPRPAEVSQEIIDLVIRFKEENPHWGCTRIRDYIVYLGYKIGETVVKNVLVQNGYDPEPDRTRKTTWKELIKSHWNVLAA